MTSLFGTDGIRGTVGDDRINPHSLLQLGWAIGQVFQSHPSSLALVGKDTRLSGYMLESSLQAGLCAAGCHVSLLGPMPTPAVAYLTHTLRASVGIMISASHNPFQDNGVKFFDSHGHKISASIQAQIDEAYQQPITVTDARHIAKVSRLSGAPGRYIEFCKSKFPYHLSLRGLRIVLDCAHGATYHIAPAVLEELGAQVIALHTEPSGTNINAHCGATHPNVLAEAVRTHQADIGFALDGDGDRMIMVDHQAKIYDGDDVLYVLARYATKPLQGVVSTIYSNQGLENSLRESGLDFQRTAVGDRHVMQALQTKQWVLGGEPSGHVVHLDYSLSGDGIISALRILAVMMQEEKPLADLIQYHKYPSVLHNIHHANPTALAKEHEATFKEISQLLDKKGRLIVRPSGTEPVLRCFVEAQSHALIQQVMSLLPSQHDVAQTTTDHPRPSYTNAQ